MGGGKNCERKLNDADQIVDGYVIFRLAGKVYSADSGVELLYLPQELGAAAGSLGRGGLPHQSTTGPNWGYGVRLTDDCGWLEEQGHGANPKKIVDRL